MSKRPFSIDYSAAIVSIVFVFLGSQMLFAASQKTETPGDAPFEYLFDGFSFHGWEGDTDAWRTNPLERSLQNFARGTIYTKKKYDNFILQLEFQVAEGGNNGLLIRVNDQMRHGGADPIEIQIGDDRDWREDFNGCVFGQMSGPKPKTLVGKTAHHGGVWNFLEVIVWDDHIVTYVNGEKVVDGTFPQHKSSQGVIGFMGWTGESAVRFIRLKPIASDYAWKNSQFEKVEKNFRRIFNGRNFRGWSGDLEKWDIVNGALASVANDGRLFTEKSYSDFVLRFDFRISKGGNNGVFLRQAPTRTTSGTEVAGLEIQVLDDWNSPDIHPAEHHGAIYNVVPPRRNSLKKTGEWNTQEIFVQGSRIKVTVNEQVILDTDIKGIEKTTQPGLHNKSGRLFFSANQASVEFKNIRIKELY